MASLVSLDDIRAAADRIRGLASWTPLLDVVPAGALPSAARLALKCENLQPGGAFKIRGAANFLARLDARVRAAGVITYSSGNHGRALALAARQFGIPAVVVMPEHAPQVKADGIRAYGAEVIVAGTTLVERRKRAEAEAAGRGLTMVPPFDHPWIIGGAGTIGLEILRDRPAVECIYVPVGGGGLISGIAAAVKHSRPEVRVVGVEPAGAAKMTAALRAGAPVTLPSTASIADGLMPVRAGDLTFAHVQALVDGMVTVTDEAIAEAVRWMFREARLVAEPSGAAGVAAALGAGRAAVAVVSGGNVDAQDFARYIA